MNVYVTTCDKYMWALKGFAHQFNKYWSALQPVTIIGYTPPDFDLPSNFSFIHKSTQDRDKWTTSLASVLRQIDDDFFTLLLDDYWLCRGVNHQAVETLYNLCQSHPQILKIDLTDDRQYNGDVKDFDYLPYYGYNDIVWSPPSAAYQTSLQAAIWNRKLLLEVLHMDEDAWQFEIGGTATNVRKRDDIWTLGTRQRPIRYANVLGSGNPNTELNLKFLLKEDVEELKRIGALEK